MKITIRPTASSPDPLLLAAFFAVSRSCHRRVVDLQFYHPTANSVCVAGTFARGRCRTIPLEHLGGGAWVARLILPSGKYEYHFVADGKWRPDPLATEFSEAPSGQVNSVLVIE